MTLILSELVLMKLTIYTMHQHYHGTEVLEQVLLHVTSILELMLADWLVLDQPYILQEELHGDASLQL